MDGNQLVVRLPEGTREMTVPADFRFNVDGKMLSVQELKPGMAGTATITTKTTVVPVTVTEVKNGTVMQAPGNSIIVRTDDGIKMFTQSDIDKRGIKIMRDGKPATIADFRPNDRLIGHHRHVEAATGHDGEGSAGDTCQERWRCRWRARGRRRPRRASAGQQHQHRREPRRLGRSRPRALRRGRCPRRPALCRFLALTGFASLLAGLGLTVRRRRATR